MGERLDWIDLDHDRDRW